MIRRIKHPNLPDRTTLTKHIDIRYHFVRHYIETKVIELFYVPSAENVSDILTKALGPDVYKKLADLLLKT